MGKKWTEADIRKELARLDAKTGLKGAELPIRFNNAKGVLGAYYHANGGSFLFSNYYYQNPDWPTETAIDTIRHEYAHHMDYVVYGNRGHGYTWKLCCDAVGAMPVRCYNEKRAEYYRKKSLAEEELSDRYDTYSVGDTISHPSYGDGTIVEILGESLNRSITVEFASVGTKRLGLAWVDNNCKKHTKKTKADLMRWDENPSM